MTDFVSSDYASLLVWELGRVALLVALAAAVVTLLLKAVRSKSPKIHRLAWCAVLLQGWLLVRLPVDVPWYGQEGASSDTPSASATLTPSDIEPSGPNAVPHPLPVQDASISLTPNPTARGDVDLASLSQGELGKSEVESVDASLHQLSEPELTEAAVGGAALPTTWLTATVSRFAPTILLLWGAGIVACVAVWAFGYVRFLRSMPKGLRVKSTWLEQWQGLLSQHSVRNAIPLRVTRNVGPMLCRRLRGYELLVPESLWRDLTESQRAAILRHELAHYRRTDVWKSLAARVLALPQWFNPLAWLAVRQFDEAAEWACDQAATAGQPRATEYARALVRLGESAARQASYSPAAHGRTLAVRVRRLLSPGTQEDSVMKKTLLVAATLTLVTVGLVRLELVAREPAVDDSIATEAFQSLAANGVASSVSDATTADTEFLHRLYLDLTGLPPKPDEVRAYLADKRDPKLKHDELLAQLVSDQSNAAKGDYRAAAVAASKAFEHAKAAFETDTITLDVLCTWSQKWLEAERKTAKSDQEEIAALESYLARTQQIHDKVKALHGAGARGGEAEKYFGMVFYLEEAKELVKAAKERSNEVSAPSRNKTPYFTVFSLHNAKAADLIPILQAAISATQGAENVKDVRMVPDPRANNLLVSAPAKTMEVIAALIGRLDENPTTALPQSAGEPTRAQSQSHETTAADRQAAIDRKLAEDRPLQELNKRLDSLRVEADDAKTKYNNPDSAKRIRETMRKVEDQIHDRMTQVQDETNAQIEQTAAIEDAGWRPLGKTSHDLSTIGNANANLRRFDGKTFDEWRKELLIELKPERRTEAIQAFRAFSVNGLGRQAAQAIVDTIRDVDPVKGIQLALSSRGELNWGYDASPDGEMLDAAAQALQAATRADATAVLLDALTNGNNNQRIFAARVLERNIPNAKEAATALIAAIEDKDALVRQSALQALGRFDPRPEAAIPAIRKALKDQNAHVVIAATQALVPIQSIGMNEDGEFISAHMGPEAVFVPEFIDLLQNPNNIVRQTTVLALGTLGQKANPALPKAITLLHSDDVALRRLACQMMVSFGQDAKLAMPDLVRIVENRSSDGQETVWAIEALGQLGPIATGAIPAIEKALQEIHDESPVTRPGRVLGDTDNKIQQALGKIRGQASKRNVANSQRLIAQELPAGKAPLPQRVSALLQVKYAPTDSRAIDPAEIRAFRATQAELLRSPSVLRHALREPGVADLSVIKEQSDPVAWLENHLVAKYENDSEILRVQLTSGPPAEAAKLVNAVVKAYFDGVVFVGEQRRQAERDKLQAAYSEREAIISKLRQQKANLAKTLGIPEGAQNTMITLLVNEVATLRNQVTVQTAWQLPPRLKPWTWRPSSKLKPILLRKKPTSTNICLRIAGCTT